MPSDTPSPLLPTPSENCSPAVQTLNGMLPAVLQHYNNLPACMDDAPKTTIDTTSREGRVMLQNVLAGESRKLWDLELPARLSILDIVCHYGEREDDESGEVVGGRIMTLVCKEGLFYTMSRWAYYDVQRAALADNWPNRTGPLEMNAIRAKCSNGHTRLAMQLV